jgi:hypothetical protein
MIMLLWIATVAPIACVGWWLFREPTTRAWEHWRWGVRVPAGDMMCGICGGFIRIGDPVEMETDGYGSWISIQGHADCYETGAPSA